MRRATTPTITIFIDVDLTSCWYRVAFKQSGVPVLVKTDQECNLTNKGHSIEVTLTQEETLGFYANNPVMIQVRYGQGNKVSATNIATIDMKTILDEVVVE